MSDVSCIVCGKDEAGLSARFGADAGRSLFRTHLVRGDRREAELAIINRIRESIARLGPMQGERALPPLESLPGRVTLCVSCHGPLLQLSRKAGADHA